jgi:hypothetical protein
MSHFRLRRFPVKVPLTFCLKPSPGKEPAYRVGMCACAITTVTPTRPHATNAKGRNIVSSLN